VKFQTVPNNQNGISNSNRGSGVKILNSNWWLDSYYANSIRL